MWLAFIGHWGTSSLSSTIKHTGVSIYIYFFFWKYHLFPVQLRAFHSNNAENPIPGDQLNLLTCKALTCINLMTIKLYKTSPVSLPCRLIFRVSIYEVYERWKTNMKNYKFTTFPGIYNSCKFHPASILTLNIRR